MAQCMGVCPSLSTLFISAPGAAMRACTTSRWPRAEAQCRGVMPLTSALFTLAPLFMMDFTSTRSPFLEASSKAVPSSSSSPPPLFLYVLRLFRTFRVFPKHFFVFRFPFVAAFFVFLPPFIEVVVGCFIYIYNAPIFIIRFQE